MISESVRKLIASLNDNYVHWDKFKDMPLPDGARHAPVWAIVKAEREQGAYRQLVAGEKTYTWWVSNAMEARLHQLDIAMAGGRDMTALLIPKQVHRHKTNACLDESITSAQLAGFPVSKKAAKEMLLKKQSPQNTGEQVCINIYRTIQLAISKKDETLTEELLMLLHQTLTKDSLPFKAVGHYRSNNKVDLSGIDTSGGYKVPDAKSIRDQMSFFLSLYNNGATPFFIHPLVKAAILHYLVVTIRPFKDANGRMARLLAQMYLLKQGYWLAEFISISNVISKFRSQYHKSFIWCQADENNMGYFIHFYLQSVQMAYKSLRDFVQRISKQKQEEKPSSIAGYNERQSAVLRWLKDDAQKVVTIRELRSVYGVSKETARTDLTALVEKGWLKYYHINKKTYAFVKGDGFDKHIDPLF